MTTPGRINLDYLSQLISVSREQDENDLIPQLFRTLQTEQENFFRNPIRVDDSPEERKKEQMRVHKLKNVYFNLGCEQVGHLLEEMYQALKEAKASRERIPKLWNEYKEEAQITMNELRAELAALAH